MSILFCFIFQFTKSILNFRVQTTQGLLFVLMQWIGEVEKLRKTALQKIVAIQNIEITDAVDPLKKDAVHSFCQAAFNCHVSLMYMFLVFL